MNKLEQAARQALDVDEALVTLELILKDGAEYGNWPLNKNCEDGLKAITALQEALAEQAEQEPCIECGRPTMSAESKCNDCHSMDDAAPVEPVKQKPVAFEDALEAAYWEFDARVKGYDKWKLNKQSERDAFKWSVRGIYAAPVQPVKQEPVAWMDLHKELGKLRWMGGDEGWDNAINAVRDRLIELATPHPVRTKDLTDVDLWKLWENSGSNIDFARAVITADREKNK